MMTETLRIAVLLSGGGRTLQNFIDSRATGALPVEIPLVIASRAGLGGTDRATAAGLRTEIADRREFTSLHAFSQRVFALCDEAGADLICLAGWLALLQIPDRYNNRILNVHPALLPSFGGKGMYGHHVHQAVIDHGCKVSGCTVHFCDNAYDTGPIVIQRTCPVFPDDTADTLAARVFEQESIAYPEAVRLYSEKRLKIEGRKVRVL